MKLVTIVGARPQFIKARPFSAAIRQNHREILVHTGQHYDANMSGNFFRDMEIPEPDYHLGIGSGSHGEMTGAMLKDIERVLLQESPDGVVVFGDTNSTLAGALAAAKLRLPVAHIEAGLRSFNRAMPEEINRIVADHVSTLLFTPSQISADQLAREGILKNVFVVGDIMYDAVRFFRAKADILSYLPELGLPQKEFYLFTLHRAENVDEKNRLESILEAIGQLSKPVLFPRHPRTEKMMQAFGLRTPSNVVITPPAGYLQMLQAEGACCCVLTDSGGVQKEAYYCGVPCVTLRSETEWTELVAAGWNIVAGTDPGTILAAVKELGSRTKPHPDLYGTGNTAQLIVNEIEKCWRGSVG